MAAGFLQQVEINLRKSSKCRALGSDLRRGAMMSLSTAAPNSSASNIPNFFDLGS